MSESDRIQRLHAALDRLEKDLGEGREQASKRTRGVAGLVRILALLMGALALANLYFVNDLTQEVGLVIANMQEMGGHFDRVSALMTDLRRTVTDMEDKVRLVPVVTAQTRALAGRMDDMRASVERMDASTADLGGRVGVMHAGVGDMSLRFRQLNQTIHGMGADVEQMSRPVP